MQKVSASLYAFLNSLQIANNAHSLFHQLLGRSQEAMEAYTDIINRNLADESSFAVAVNNFVSLKGTRDVSDNLRKLDRLKEKDAQGFQLAHGLEKLSPKQRETIYANRVLLLLHANKLDQVFYLSFCIHQFASFTLKIVKTK